MKVDEKQICRLCLYVADNEFNEIEEITKEMLEVLLLETDWNIIENPMICRTCMGIIKRSFYFKSACVHAEKLVASFAVNKEAELELEDIVHSERGTEMVIEENFRCRFCMNCVKENSLIFIHILTEDIFYKEMLLVFMPEMDFSSIKNPGVCSRCREHLDCYFMFIRTFLETENKLYAYCQHTSSNGSRRIKSGDVLHLLRIGNMTKSNEIKWKLTSDELDGVYSCEVLKIEKILDIRDDQVLNEESNIETDMAMNNSHQRSTINKVIHKSTLCTKVPTYKRALKDKDESEVGMYKCSLCPYKTKWKNYFLYRHMLVHKDISEVKMYKCGLCLYATKYKHYLRGHMLTHKDASEVKQFKCGSCTFAAKWKSDLTKHALTHKDASEVDMHKCSLCSYKTIFKQYLRNHMKIHQDASEVDMYKCLHCPYETNIKSRLRKHMIVHRDISEVKVYKCDLCIYVTKYKSTLQRHALTHKDDSEVDMHKCSLCSYMTKFKRYLKNHMKVHQDASELDMYKCSRCTYEAKFKDNLRKHELVHRRHMLTAERGVKIEDV